MYIWLVANLLSSVLSQSTKQLVQHSNSSVQTLIILILREQIVTKSNETIKLKEEFRNKKALFLNMVNVNLKITKIPKKVEKFSDLDFNEFLQIIKRETKENLQLKEIDEWEYYFKSYQKDLVKLKYN